MNMVLEFFGETSLFGNEIQSFMQVQGTQAISVLTQTEVEGNRDTNTRNRSGRVSHLNTPSYMRKSSEPLDGV